MARHILIAYATKHGSTQEVAESIAATLADEGAEVDVQQAARVKAIDGYDGVVLGGSLYTGRWHRDARHFLVRHRKALADIPIAVFALGPKTLEETDVAASQEQLERALAQVPGVEPVSTAIFGGVLDPAKLHFPFSRMPASDARDWEAISDWARTLPVRETIAAAR